ncbi:MAG: sulfotransferase [Bacteroidota bacterium]
MNSTITKIKLAVILNIMTTISASNSKHPIIFQLSPARCGSTALLRSFSRNDFKVLNEPMLKPFLLNRGADKAAFRVATQTSFTDVKNTILSMQLESPVFIKDMIFFSYDWLSSENKLLADPSVKFILMVRHPYDSMMSFYKKVGSSLSPIQSNGYKQMWDLYQLLKNTITPDRYTVVFAEELFSKPEETLKQVYNHLELPFDTKVLSWDAKDDSFDGSLWMDPKRTEQFHFWHDDAAKSSHFKPLNSAPHTFECVKDEDKALIKELYNEALIYYERLKEAIDKP